MDYEGIGKAIELSSLTRSEREEIARKNYSEVAKRLRLLAQASYLYGVYRKPIKVADHERPAPGIARILATVVEKANGRWVPISRRGQGRGTQSAWQVNEGPSNHFRIDFDRTAGNRSLVIPIFIDFEEFRLSNSNGTYLPATELESRLRDMASTATMLEDAIANRADNAEIRASYDALIEAAA